LVNNFPRLASWAPLRRLIVDHLLCPLIAIPLFNGIVWFSSLPSQ